MEMNELKGGLTHEEVRKNIPSRNEFKVNTSTSTLANHQAQCLHLFNVELLCDRLALVAVHKPEHHLLQSSALMPYPGLLQSSKANG